MKLSADNGSLGISEDKATIQPEFANVALKSLCK